MLHFAASMKEDKETLGEFVRRTRAEKGFSTRTVAARSGGSISDGYVSRIENGYAINPSPKLIRALARGLGIKEDILFSVVRGQAAQIDDIEDFYGTALYELYQRRKQAAPEDQKLIDEFIDMVLDRMKRRPTVQKQRPGA